MTGVSLFHCATPRCRRQGGYSLAGLALALALTSLLALWGSNQLVQRIEDAAARSAGVWMAQVRQAAAGMLARHFDALARGAAPLDDTGAAMFVDPLSPTVAELRALAHLPTNFPEKSALGFGAQVRVLRGGGCPGERCRIDALVYSATPVLKPGTRSPDLVSLASVIEAAGGYGGAVWPETPAQARGAAFSFSNPLMPGAPTYAPGTLALWAGAGSELGSDTPPAFPDLEPFVRIGDARDPTLAGSLSVAASVAAGAYLSVGARGLPGHACGLVNGTMASTDAGRAAGVPIRRLATRQQRVRRRIQHQQPVRMPALFGPVDSESAHGRLFVSRGLPARYRVGGREMDRNRGLDNWLCLRPLALPPVHSALFRQPSIIKDSPKSCVIHDEIL